MKRDPAEVARIKASIAKVSLSPRPNTRPPTDMSSQHVADAKVQYKHLAGGVEFIDVIPKNPSGKLLRRYLRNKAKEMLAKGELKLATKSKLQTLVTRRLRIPNAECNRIRNTIESNRCAKVPVQRYRDCI